MKRSIIALLLIISSLSAGAQDLLNIQASSGVAFPLGKISDNNVQDSSAGHSTVGGMVEFRMGIKPWKFIGFVFNGGLGMFPIRKSFFNQYVLDKNGLDIKPTAGNYRFGYASGGVMFAYRPPIKDRWILDYSVTAGYLWAESPDVELKQNDTIYFKSYKSYGGGWMISTNFSFRFRVFKTFYVGAGLEYMYARPQFTNQVVEQRSLGTTYTQQNTFTQNMSIIYLSGQIGLTF